MSKVTGAHTVLNALIDVDTGQDPMTRTESFERWLGDYPLGEDASIQNILALQRLWEGGGKPFIDDKSVTYRPSFRPDRREQPLFYSIASLLGNDEYPVDTLRVASLSKRNEPFNIRRSKGSGLTSTGALVDDFIAELSHAYFYKDYDTPLSSTNRNVAYEKSREQRATYGENVYNMPRMHEWQTHKKIEPFLKYILEKHGGVIDQGWRENFPNWTNFGPEMIMQLAKEFTTTRCKRYSK